MLARAVVPHARAGIPVDRVTLAVDTVTIPGGPSAIPGVIDSIADSRLRISATRGEVPWATVSAATSRVTIPAADNAN